jgi:hypothetical protein
MGSTDTREPEMSLTEQTPQSEPVQRHGRSSGERLVIAVSVVVTALAIAGIGYLALRDGEPDPPPPPSPSTAIEPSAEPESPEPPSAANAEDLAAEAAQARYLEYLRVTAQVADSGLIDLAAWNTVAIDPQTGVLLLSAEQNQRNGITTSNDTEVLSLAVQAVDLDPPGAFPSVRLLACLDVSRNTAVNAAGDSVVSPAFPDRLRSEVVVRDVAPGSFTDGRKPGWYVAEVVQRGEPC